MVNDMNNYDVIIIGGALTGIALACVLASQQLSVAVIESRDPADIMGEHSDGRTCAISFGSKKILEQYGLWAAMERKAGPIWDIRITDGNSPFFLHYDHELVGNQPMGYIVENHHVLTSLYDIAKTLPTLTLYAPAGYTHIARSARDVVVTLTNGRNITGNLLVAADGRFSKVRKEVGIDTLEWSYKQSAIVCNITHEFDHKGVALEHFLPAGPFASLPMYGGKMSSLVWTEKTEMAPVFLAMDDAEFILEIEKRLGTHLGKISLASKRFCYPLSLVHAKTYTANRLALVGDAAHAIHPIAGQGFNLGIRDIGVLAKLLIDTKQLGLSIGTLDILSQYEKSRRRDNMVMIAVTDVLNRLFSNDNLPLRASRRLGLAVINKLPFVKKFFMQHAMGMYGEKK